MIYELDSVQPQLHETVYVAPGAHVIGDVRVGSRSSVWFGTVLRGDVNDIRIGAQTNIQDHCIVHSKREIGVEIGDRVTLGHRVTAHGCRIGDEVLIGMDSTVLDGVIVPSGTVVAAGSLVPPGSTLEPESLYMGSPVEKVRDLREEDRENISRAYCHYVSHAEQYRTSLRPQSRISDSPG